MLSTGKASLDLSRVVLDLKTPLGGYVDTAVKPLTAALVEISKLSSVQREVENLT